MPVPLPVFIFQNNLNSIELGHTNIAIYHRTIGYESITKPLKYHRTKNVGVSLFSEINGRSKWAKIGLVALPLFIFHKNLPIASNSGTDTLQRLLYLIELFAVDENGMDVSL